MNIEHIKPFITGAQSVMNQVCGENVTVGKMFAKEHPYKCESVSVTALVGGDITGNVIYTMGQPLACALASKMMGMTVSALDDMTKSAVAELTNMMSSNASMALSGGGLKTNLSAPMLRVDAPPSDFDFIKPGAKLICVPMQLQNGSVFELDFMFN